MTGFLYFLPEFAGQSVSPAQIESAGLGYAFENKGKKVALPLSNGPGGNPGMLLGNTDKLEVGRIKFDRDRQTWVNYAAAGYWVGMWNEAKPGPADLLRSKPLSGEALTLGDDRQWLVPYARRYSAEDDAIVYSIALDCTVDLLSDTLEGDVVPRHAKLWALSEAYIRYWKSIYSEDQAELAERDAAMFTGRELFVNIVRILQANYLVDLPECQLLGLMLRSTPSAVLNIFNDLTTYEELRKKKSKETLTRPAAGQPSSNGQEANSPSTDQPLRTY
jgi:hypothetical protein